jgi:hypothetical protein
MSIEVEKSVFEKGLVLLSSESNVVSLTKLPKQYEWLEEIGFDLMEDCEHHGTFIEDEVWKNPDDEKIMEYFEVTLEDPDSRMSKFDSDKKLSDKEREGLKNFIEDKCLEDGDCPKVYVGEVRYNHNCIVVFTSRSGYSWSDFNVELLGMFNDIEEGEKNLFKDGVMY